MPNYLPLTFRHLTEMPLLQASPMLDKCLPSALNEGVEARVNLVIDPGDKVRVHLKFWRPYEGDRALYFVAELWDQDEINDPLACFGPPTRAVAACEQQYPELIREL